MKVIVLALAFAAVFESFFPVIAPHLWKRSLAELSKADEAFVRRVALVILAAALTVIWTVTEIT